MALSGPHLWRDAGRLSLTLTLLGAALYLGQQWVRFGRFDDPYFVGLVAANTLTVYRFGLYMRDRVEELFAALLEEPDPVPGTPSANEAARRILGDPRALAAGLGFAALLAGAAAVMAPWPEPRLNLLLCGFLFVANVIVGMGLFALARYWHLSGLAVGRMTFRILNLSRPDLAKFIEINSLLVLVVAFISALAVGALLLSRFDTGTPAIAFSAFSLFVVLMTYAAPLVPLAGRLNQAKLRELNRIERLIDAKYRAATGAGEPPDPDPDLDLLLSYRQTVRAVRTFPPNGRFSVSTAALATLLSFTPRLVEYGLDKLAP